VTLSSYSALKYEVTFKEMDIYSRAIGEEIVTPKTRHWDVHQPEYPATKVTWYQARGYCQWVGQRLLGYPMDLMSEAQWEYAARNRGQAIAHATNNGKIERDINIADRFDPMPVGSWPPNPLGMHDMTGNVNEWVLDWYISAYPKQDETDPTGPPLEIDRNEKVTRDISTNAVYTRQPNDPDSTGNRTAIRCALNHPEKITAPKLK
jgi:formylglycine-generating enzyme required for sulfatase activity